MLEQGRRESDPAKRRAIYVPIEKLALDEALTVPLVDELSVWAFRAGVQGVKYNFNAYPILSDVASASSVAQGTTLGRRADLDRAADPRRGAGAVRGHAGRLQHAVPGPRRSRQDDAGRVRHQPRSGRADARPAPPRRAHPRAVRALRGQRRSAATWARRSAAAGPSPPRSARTSRSTAQLALAAMLVAVALGVPLGLAGRARRGTRGWTWARWAWPCSGVSMPSFWLGLLLIFVFSLHLGWFPATGGGDLAHLVLPAVTLGRDRRGHHRAAHPLEHAGGARPGLRAHGARQGARRRGVVVRATPSRTR